FTGGHCKRQDKLIEALRTLVTGPRAVPAELHPAGSIHPEPEHRAYFLRLQKAAQGLPVHFHPNCSPQELTEPYRTSSVYWHATGLGADLEAEPHKAEHFGISVIEAMSAGCIPLVYAAGGPTETVAHGRTGYHFRSLAELCELTRQVLRQPAAETEVMRLAAAAAARAYSDAAFAGRVRALVARLL